MSIDGRSLDRLDLSYDASQVYFSFELHRKAAFIRAEPEIELTPFAKQAADQSDRL
jgi:hypothetical protein